MQSRLGLWIRIAILCLQGTALAITIDTNTYLTSPPNEDITINSNVFLAMVDTGSETFTAGINNNGYMFLGNVESGKSGQVFKLTGSGQTSNQGTIVLDNRNETNGVSLEWDGSSFINSGTMYFMGADSPQNSYTFSQSGEFNNKGTMVFSQGTKNTDSYANFQANTVQNDGTICLTNTKSLLKKSINGNGCITIGENSMMVLQSTGSGTMGPQTLYMTSQSSIIFAESDSKTDNIIVRGFGNGNFLTFRTSVDPFRGKWSYDSTKGILTVKLWPSITHAFNIGTGYDSGKFKWKSISNHVTPDLVNNAVIYDGPVPDTSRPSICNICPNNSPWIPQENYITHIEQWTGEEISTVNTNMQIYTDTNGNLLDDISYDVKSPMKRISSTIENPWTGNETTTYSTDVQTFSGSDGKETIETIYYVETPIEYITSTSVTAWTGNETTTYSTEVATLVGSDGKETIETIYYVETPIEYITSTSVTAWTGNETTTYSTEVATLVGSDGKETIETIYYVETPIEYITSTSVTAWTGNETTTYSTEVATLVGSDGKETIETIYYVETPIEYITSTSVTAWTGNETTTYSTDVQTFSGSDGKETIETIYYVETPIEYITSTSVTAWTGNETTTYSTEVATLVGSDGKETIETIYYVETPIEYITSTSVTAWTGNETTTYSTDVQTFSGSDGKETIETIYYVETPIEYITSTSVTAWTGNETTTYSTDVQTFSGSDGKETIETIYYVETPIEYITSTSVTAWTGNETTTYSTDVQTFSGSDGKETIETIYYVETPIEYITSTSVTAWTGNETTTYSTDVQTFSGSDGKETIETIYYVETPIEYITSTSVTAWTGNETTTYSTEVATLVGSDGKETIETIYYVETPIEYITSTSVTAWTGNETTTYSTEVATLVGSDGKETIETIYYVETPIEYITSTSVTAWTGNETTTYSTEVSTVIASDDNMSIEPESFSQSNISYNRSSDSSSVHPQSVYSGSGGFQVSSELKSSSTSQLPFESAYTTSYKSNEWRVVEIVSYYVVTLLNGSFEQGINTSYFADRVDAQPLFLSSSIFSDVLTSSSNSQKTENIESSSRYTSSNEMTDRYTPSIYLNSSSRRYETQSSSIVTGKPSLFPSTLKGAVTTKESTSSSYSTTDHSINDYKTLSSDSILVTQSRSANINSTKAFSDLPSSTEDYQHSSFEVQTVTTTRLLTTPVTLISCVDHKCNDTMDKSESIISTISVSGKITNTFEETTMYNNQPSKNVSQTVSTATVIHYSTTYNQKHNTSSMEIEVSSKLHDSASSKLYSSQDDNGDMTTKIDSNNIMLSRSSTDILSNASIVVTKPSSSVSPDSTLYNTQSAKLQNHVSDVASSSSVGSSSSISSSSSIHSSSSVNNITRNGPVLASTESIGLHNRTISVSNSGSTLVTKTSTNGLSHKEKSTSSTYGMEQFANTAANINPSYGFSIGIILVITIASIM
ncbi:some similarities with uniprot [Nakaseomyces bracarensis]|uniref:Some similarities with uniprot n=1 Tax=Nakaseomyces bracarensis TaxID=273131 RepID=A0ABR4NP86_9SACH